MIFPPALSCKDIPIITNAVNVNIQARLMAVTHFVGDEVTYQCEEGFTHRSDQVLTCLPNREWSLTAGCESK